MRVISSSGKTVIEKRQIDGASTNIPAGALLMPGVSDETDRSVLIIASGAAADAAGILLEANTANATNNAVPVMPAATPTPLSNPVNTGLPLPQETIAPTEASPAPDSSPVAALPTAQN